MCEMYGTPVCHEVTSLCFNSISLVYYQFILIFNTKSNILDI